MEINAFFRSKTFKGILYGIGIAFLLLIVFSLGMAVGFRKASFSYRWGDNYHQNFAGPKEGFGSRLQGGAFLNSHGTFGTVLSADATSLVIKNQNEPEKIVLIKPDTEIRRFRDSVAKEDVKIGDMVVVIGSPNEKGEIEAKLIRIIPSPTGVVSNQGR